MYIGVVFKYFSLNGSFTGELVNRCREKYQLGFRLCDLDYAHICCFNLKRVVAYTAAQRHSGWLVPLVDRCHARVKSSTSINGSGRSFCRLKAVAGLNFTSSPTGSIPNLDRALLPVLSFTLLAS